MKAIAGLAFKYIFANKKSLFVIMFIIAVSASMFTLTMSIGNALYNRVVLQAVRMSGTASHMTLYFLPGRYLPILHEQDFIKDIGSSFLVAKVDTHAYPLLNCIELVYMDQYTRQFGTQARTNFVGNFPLQVNEIAIDRDTLYLMGIDTPELGMEITLTYDTRVKYETTRTFVLSGMYTSYMWMYNDGCRPLHVSYSFFSSYGSTEPDAVHIAFVDSDNVEHYSHIVNNLIYGVDGLFFPVSVRHTPNAQMPVVPMAIIIFFIFFASYLLISNVVDISASSQIRLFGLLACIGVSARQILMFVVLQVLFLSIIGISVGLLSGLAFARVLMPFFAGEVWVNTGMSIAVSPVIMLLATAISFFTVLFSSIFAAYKASSCSPIDASKFTQHLQLNYRGTVDSPSIVKPMRNGLDGVVPGTVKRVFLNVFPMRGETDSELFYKKQHNATGAMMYRFAWRNLFRSKNRTIKAIVSLSLGFVTLIVIASLVQGIDILQITQRDTDYDFIIRAAAADQGPADFDQGFVDMVRAVPHVQDVFYTRFTTGILNNYFNPDVIVALWVHAVHSYKLQEIVDYFGGKMDIAAFERGEAAVIITDSPHLYNELETLDWYVVAEGLGGYAHSSITLGGIFPYGPPWRANYSTTTATDGVLRPTVLIHNTFADLLTQTSGVQWVIPRYRLNVVSDASFDREVLDALESLISAQTFASSVRLEPSRGLQRLSMEQAVMYITILGGGISIILGLAGLLNFTNNMLASIYARQQEFAILESIGASSKQLTVMMIFEGTYYGILSILSGVLMGTIIAKILVSQISRTAYFYGMVSFTFPFAYVLFVIMAVMLACTLLPYIVYKNATNTVLVERIK